MPIAYDRFLDFPHCPRCGSSMLEDLLGFDPNSPDAEVTDCHGEPVVPECVDACVHD